MAVLASRWLERRRGGAPFSPFSWRSLPPIAYTLRTSLYLREAADLAVKATESLGLFYAGVDIVESNPMRVLEVNSLPSFVRMNEATDVNPADYIWRGIKRRTGRS